MLASGRDLETVDPSTAPALQRGAVVRDDSVIGLPGMTWLGRHAGVAACAVIAGAFCTGFGWRDGNAWLRLCAVLVLTAGAWPLINWAFVYLPWAEVLPTWRTWSEPAPAVAQLPYTQPGSASARSSAQLGQARAWAKQYVLPRYGPMLVAACAALLIAFTMAALLGERALLLSVLGIVLGQLGAIISRGSGRPAALWFGAAAIALPMAFGAVLGSRFGWVLPGLVAGAAIGGASAYIPPSRRRTLWRSVGAGLTLLTVIAAQYPAAVFFAAVGGAAQLLLPARRPQRAVLWVLGTAIAVGAAIGWS